MFWSSLIAFAALAKAMPAEIVQRQGGSTMLRFGCSQIAIDRIDPLVNPGVAPSPHMHQIVGGNAFNTSIPSTDVSSLTTCTSCSFADDFSNYWTANMYFKARNGSFKRVPQVPARYVLLSNALFQLTYTFLRLDWSSTISSVLKSRAALLSIMSPMAKEKLQHLSQ
jgi:hypothetical protein